MGDEVEAMILDVDRRKKQIRLSIKAAMPKPEEVLAEVTQPEPRKSHAKKSKKQEEYLCCLTSNFSHKHCFSSYLISQEGQNQNNLRGLLLSGFRAG